MHTRTLRRTTLLILVSAGALWGTGCAKQVSAPAPLKEHSAHPGFLQEYAATSRFRLGQPRAIKVLPDASTVLYLRSGGTDFEQSLFAFDTRSGTNRVLLTSEQLLGDATEELSAEELARRERTRSTARGIASFSVSDDGRTLLVPLSGSLFLYDMDSATVERIADVGPGVLDARQSPDGTKIAFVRGHDLVVMDIASKHEHVIRSGRAPHEFVGQAEFVAQEEMSRMHGYWWAPDSRSIAYQVHDVSDLLEFTIADPKNPAKAARTWPYPRAGTNNARVRVFHSNADGSRERELEWDRERYPYLATVKWQENAPLTLVVQNRAQTEHAILAEQTPGSGLVRLHTEYDDAWINLDQAVPLWLADGSAFLWTTERAGAWQVELRDRDGALERVVLEPTPNFRGIVGIDDARGLVYYRAGEDPLESQLYRVGIRADSDPLLLTPHQPGQHFATLAENGDAIVHTFVPANGERRWMVRQISERGLEPASGDIPSATEQPGFGVNVEFTQVGTSDPLNCAVIRPRDFVPGERYPVVLHVYGGPHSQRVVRDPSRYILDQWIADHGFIVVWADGRGTPQRGRDWERAIKGDFISLPLEDQVRALELLAEQIPEMDMGRVGVFGWSFGGYFSAMATMRRPDIFTCGVAGAPVCEWEDYDTHYTERYIGHPDEDPRAYEVSNVLTYADQLERPLLIIHGTADDNVYLVHALKMSDALTRAGIDHEFMPLAGHTHMVTEPKIVAQMYARIMRFFAEHLQGAG